LASLSHLPHRRRLLLLVPVAQAVLVLLAQPQPVVLQPVVLQPQAQLLVA